MFEFRVSVKQLKKLVLINIVHGWHFGGYDIEQRFFIYEKLSDSYQFPFW